MTRYIVTVKLPKNSDHDPRNKVIGTCPINRDATCTDVTGEHHSFLVEAYTWDEAMKEAKLLFGHVTRVEEVA